MQNYSHTETLCDPRIAQLKAAQLEVAVCEYRTQAARARLNAIACEVQGKLDEMLSWVERAERNAADAHAIEAQRQDLIARYIPPITLDVELVDDCGVAA